MFIAITKKKQNNVKQNATLSSKGEPTLVDPNTFS